MSFGFINNSLKSAPNNRNHFILENGITLDSMFPAGNIGFANLVNSNPCTIELRGNTDFKNDPLSRYWLYFRLIYDQNIKKIKFILKDANHLRKFINQKINKPKMVYRKQGDWSILDSDIQIKILEDNSVQAYFYLQLQNFKEQQTKRQCKQKWLLDKEQNAFTIETNSKCISLKQKEKQQIFLSINYPYTNQHLQAFLHDKAESLKKTDFINIQSKSFAHKIYYNQEILTYSVQRRKISMLTITSSSNIQSFQQRQSKIHQNIFPQLKNRPFKLKNAPIILITARVHPSQISSSFFVQGIINQLTNQNNLSSKILLQTFIFMIVPILNPDGVCNGNYRHDNSLKNLNRYYGDSSFEETPQIKALQLLVKYYQNSLVSIDQRDKILTNRIMMYLDVHGHQSARSSFLFGNYTQNIHHMIENRFFCKLIQKNFIKGEFQTNQCEFSKKNMYVKQKYDQNSKLFSGRAFVGSQIQDATQETCQTFHSYTLEVVPFFNSIQIQTKKSITLIQYSKELAKSVLLSFCSLLQLNKMSQKCKQFTNLKQLKINSCKQAIIQLQRLKISSQLPIKKYDKKIAEIKNIIKIFSSGEYQFFKNSYSTWFKDYIFIQTLLKNDNLSQTFKQKIITKDQIRWSLLSDLSAKEKSIKSQAQETITLKTKTILRKQMPVYRQQKNKKTIMNKAKDELQLIKKQIKDNLKRYKMEDYRNEVLEKISAKKFKKMNLVNIGPIQIEDIGVRCNESEFKAVDYQLSLYKRRKYARIKTDVVSPFHADQNMCKNINLRIYKQSKKVQHRIKTQEVAIHEQRISKLNPVLTQNQKHISLQPRDQLIRKKIFDIQKKRSLSTNNKQDKNDYLKLKGDKFSLVQIKGQVFRENNSDFDTIQNGFPKLSQQNRKFYNRSQQKYNFSSQLSQKKQQAEFSNNYCKQKSYLSEVKQILKQKRIQIFKEYKQKKRQFESKDNNSNNTNVFLVSRFKSFIHNNSKS